MWEGGYQNERSSDAKPNRLRYTGKIPGGKKTHNNEYGWQKLVTYIIHNALQSYHISSLLGCRHFQQIFVQMWSVMLLLPFWQGRSWLVNYEHCLNWTSGCLRGLWSPEELTLPHWDPWLLQKIKPTDKHQKMYLETVRWPFFNINLHWKSEILGITWTFYVLTWKVQFWLDWLKRWHKCKKKNGELNN